MAQMVMLSTEGRLRMPSTSGVATPPTVLALDTNKPCRFPEAFAESAYTSAYMAAPKAKEG